MGRGEEWNEFPGSVLNRDLFLNSLLLQGQKIVLSNAYAYGGRGAGGVLTVTHGRRLTQMRNRASWEGNKLGGALAAREA